MQAHAGLTSEHWLVLHWESISRLTEGEHLGMFDDINEMMLRYLCVIDDHPADPLESQSGSAAELARLQLKTNLMLSLLGELLWGQLRLTLPKRVRLSPKTIAWEDVNVPEPGQLLKLSIYPRANFPLKLSFFARATELLRQGESRAMVAADLCEPSESVLYWLEKYIFQLHRRTIARGTSDGE